MPSPSVSNLVRSDWIPILFDNFPFGEFIEERDALRVLAAVCKDWRDCLYHPSRLYGWIAKYNRFGYLWDYVVSNPDLIREIARRFTPMSNKDPKCINIAWYLTCDRHIRHMLDRKYFETLWIVAVEWRPRKVWDSREWADNRPDVGTLGALLDAAFCARGMEYVKRACDILHRFDAMSAEHVAKRVLYSCGLYGRYTKLTETMQADIARHLLTVFPIANAWVRPDKMALLDSATGL